MRQETKSLRYEAETLFHIFVSNGCLSILYHTKISFIIINHISRTAARFTLANTMFQVLSEKDGYCR